MASEQGYRQGAGSWPERSHLLIAACCAAFRSLKALHAHNSAALRIFAPLDPGPVTAIFPLPHRKAASPMRSAFVLCTGLLQAVCLQAAPFGGTAQALPATLKAGNFDTVRVSACAATPRCTEITPNIFLPASVDQERSSFVSFASRRMNHR